MNIYRKLTILTAIHPNQSILRQSEYSKGDRCHSVILHIVQTYIKVHYHIWPALSTRIDNWQLWLSSQYHHWYYYIIACLQHLFVDILWFTDYCGPE